METKHLTPEERIDAALERILRAAGSARLVQYMPVTRNAMRQAMRDVMSGEYIAGSNACEAAIEFAKQHASSNTQVERP